MKTEWENIKKHWYVPTNKLLISNKPRWVISLKVTKKYNQIKGIFSDPKILFLEINICFIFVQTLNAFWTKLIFCSWLGCWLRYIFLYFHSNPMAGYCVNYKRPVVIYLPIAFNIRRKKQQDFWKSHLNVNDKIFFKDYFHILVTKRF